MWRPDLYYYHTRSPSKWQYILFYGRILSLRDWRDDLCLNELARLEQRVQEFGLKGSEGPSLLWSGVEG